MRHTEKHFPRFDKFPRQNAIKKRTLEWVMYNVKGYLNPRWRLVTIDLRSKSYVHVLRCNEELCCRFIFTNLQQSVDLYR